MATLIINALTDELETKKIKGKLSFTNDAEYNAEEEAWVDSGYVKGTLTTHEYLPDIRDIRSDRYQLSDIIVVSESFGSDDFDISYMFFAYNHSILPDPLTPEQVKELEEIAYAYEKNNCGFLYGVTDTVGKNSN